jgi:hypothetical protein
LYSSSTLATPSLSLWNVGYTKTSATLGAIPLTITGSKKIGTNVFKFTKSVTTNSSGNATLANLEWDVYDIIMNNPAYDIGEACKAIPYALAPGVSETLTLTLLPAVTTSLRVAVVNGAGVEVPNATVRLSRGGYDQTVTSSACGQAMFSGGLPVANNYSLTVNAFGYVSQTLSDIVIDGTETLVVTLVAS